MGLDAESRDHTEIIRQKRRKRLLEKAAAEGRPIGKPIEATAITKPSSK